MSYLTLTRFLKVIEDKGALYSISSALRHQRHKGWEV